MTIDLDTPACTGNTGPQGSRARRQSGAGWARLRVQVATALTALTLSANGFAQILPGGAGMGAGTGADGMGGGARLPGADYGSVMQPGLGGPIMLPLGPQLLPGFQPDAAYGMQPLRPETAFPAPLPPEPPSDFQRFVEFATGRLLPVFGMPLFQSGRFEPLQARQVPDNHVIGAGDELVVHIYGTVNFTGRLIVDRSGQIFIPKVGPVSVAGLRFRDAEAQLNRSIGEVYRNFRLSVSMGRLRSIEIYILGQARSPGRKVVSSLSTLINALFETGGPSTRGSMRAIELRRAGKVIARVDLYDFIARGDSSADRQLEPGDIIYIPPVGPQVALAGSINEQAIYELPPSGANIRSVLELTGGLPALAAPQRAQLERVDPSRDPARFVQDIALDAAGLGTQLRAGDIVTVLQISPQFSNAVTLLGSVAAPMRYAFRPGMKVSDLVDSNSLLVPVSYWLRVNLGMGMHGLDAPEVNLEYATIQRFDPTKLRTETLPFNLAKALLGNPKENLPLKPGDVVRIYAADEPGADSFDSISLQASFFDSVRRFSWREGYRITDVIPDLPWLREQVTRWVRTHGLMVVLPGQPGAPVAGSAGRTSGQSGPATPSFPGTPGWQGTPGIQGSWGHGGAPAMPGQPLAGGAGAPTRWGVSPQATAEGAGGIPLGATPNIPGATPAAATAAVAGVSGSPNLAALLGAAAIPGAVPSSASRSAGSAPTQSTSGSPGPAQPPSSGASPVGTGGGAMLSSGQAADAAAANIARLSAAALQELNLDYADIKRLDPETMQVQLIPFNLARALAGQESDNLQLQRGDRITLYTKQEVAVPIARRTRLVKVTGEVNVPGVYPVGATETLTDVIKRAGGLTKNAYVYGTSLVRESIRAEQQRNLAQLIRTMEADLASQASTLSQNLTQSDPQVVQAMLAFQRQIVERLRTIEVTGRIALDLDERADRPSLPGLVLEDGDSISIPTESDFVSVFGAVDISSTLLYRPGQKVRDYLDRAGLRAFADIDNVVLLRADGTARTARNAQQRNSFFSWNGDGLLDLQVKPGDAILVPEQVDRRTGFTRFMIGAKDWTQLIYQFGLGAAAFKVLRQ